MCSAPDKELDRIFVFRFDGASGRLSLANSSRATRPAAGARQLAFNPRLPIAWVLSSTVRPRHACWDADRGTLARVPSEHCPATDFTGYSTAAECRVQRWSLCLRGHDSVALVAADAASGLLTPIGGQPMQGRTPRFIGLNPTGACSKRTMNWETPSSHCKRWVATRARWRGPGLRTPAPSVLSSFPALSIRPWCCPSLVRPMPARPTANVTNRIRRSPAMTGLANVAAMPFEVQCRMVSP